MKESGRSESSLLPLSPLKAKPSTMIVETACEKSHDKSVTKGVAKMRLACNTHIRVLLFTALVLTFGSLGFAQSDVVAINASGQTISGTSWVADQDYSGGSTSTFTASINTSNVTDPAPMAVYQTQRWGNSTYTIPGLTAGDNYTVRLHFAECNWPGAGEREFNVSINGTQVLNNFDILASAGGENIAIVKQFTATANSSGQIVIAFTKGAADQATISGIEIQTSES